MGVLHAVYGQGEYLCLLGIALTLRRSWSVFRAIGLDAVLHNEVLVLSLLLFTWPRGRQRSSSSGGIPFQNTGG